MKRKNLTRLWCSQEAKRKLKAQASLEGMPLQEYLDKLTETALQEKKKNERYGGGFF